MPEELLDRRAGAPFPVEDLVAPFLLGPFRLLDRLFTGGRVTEAFGLDPSRAVAAGPERPATNSR